MTQYDLYAQLHDSMRIRMHDAVFLVVRAPSVIMALERMSRRNEGPWLQLWDMYWDAIRGGKVVVNPDLVREYVGE